MNRRAPSWSPASRTDTCRIPVIDGQVDEDTREIAFPWDRPTVAAQTAHRRRTTRRAAAWAGFVLLLALELVFSIQLGEYLYALATGSIR